MEISIVISEQQQETRLIGPIAGRTDRDAVTMAILLRELRPAASVVFILGSQKGNFAFTATEILADWAEAEHVQAMKANNALIEKLTDPALRAAPPKETPRIAALVASAGAPTDDEPAPRAPRPDPDEDELASSAPAKRNHPDDDEVARP